MLICHSGKWLISFLFGELCCSLKLTLSAERVPPIPFDVKLGKEEVNGSCISQDKFPLDEISQQVLVMLTTPLSTSRMVLP